MRTSNRCSLVLARTASALETCRPCCQLSREDSQKKAGRDGEGKGREGKANIRLGAGDGANVTLSDGDGASNIESDMDDGYDLGDMGGGDGTVGRPEVGKAGESVAIPGRRFGVEFGAASEVVVRVGVVERVGKLVVLRSGASRSKSPRARLKAERLSRDIALRGVVGKLR